MIQVDLAFVAKTAGTLVAIVLGYVALPRFWRYAKSIRKRLYQQSNRFFRPENPFRFIRDKETPREQRSPISILELNPDFVAKSARDGWKLLSLGDYLSQLRPAVLPPSVSPEDLPGWIQSEIEAALAGALMERLGPVVGAAMLPTVGVLHAPVEKLSASNAVLQFVSNFVLSRAAAYQSSNKENRDAGFVPFSFSELSSLADVHARFTSAGPVDATTFSDEKVMDPTTPLGALRLGEIAYYPHFGMKHQGAAGKDSTALRGDVELVEEDLVPNPFIVDRHWDRAIQGMEMLEEMKLNGDLNGEKTSKEEERKAFDPDGRSLPTPTPVNERLLPGLRSGFGNAQCTHTNREIIRNRLMCVILNRLASNYFFESELRVSHDFEKFTVFLSEGQKALSTPTDFVEALLKTGHSIEVCPRSTITTFGFGLCVEEEDGDFSNIPLTFFFQSGFESRHGQPVLSYLPHGGIELEISGPLVGSGNRCNIANYIAIEGLCGWHSNHNVDCPWIRKVDTSAPLSETDAIEAIRICALNCVNTNVVGMNLPFGGYGLVGVCNDSAAMVELAVSSSTNVYPLTSLGRFLAMTIRSAKLWRDRKKDDPSFRKEFQSLNKMIAAWTKLPSDLCPLPSVAVTTAERFLNYLPEDLPFQTMVESKSAMESIVREHVEYASISD